VYFLKDVLICDICLLHACQGVQQQAKSLCAAGEVQTQLEQKGNTFCNQQDWRYSSVFLDLELLITHFINKNEAGKV